MKYFHRMLSTFNYITQQAARRTSSLILFISPDR